MAMLLEAVAAAVSMTLTLAASVFSLLLSLFSCQCLCFFLSLGPVVSELQIDLLLLARRPFHQVVLTDTRTSWSHLRCNDWHW